MFVFVVFITMSVFTAANICLSFINRSYNVFNGLLFKYLILLLVYVI